MACWLAVLFFDVRVLRGCNHCSCSPGSLLRREGFTVMRRRHNWFVEASCTDSIFVYLADKQSSSR